MPFCPFHKGKTECVCHKGWADTPRRVGGDIAPEYIWGARYECKLRRDAVEPLRPFGWHSYHVDVTAQYQSYVRQQWNRLGAFVTWRTALSHKAKDGLHATVARGLGISAFQGFKLEGHYLEHRRREQMFYDAVNHGAHDFQKHMRPAKERFPAYYSEEYGGYFPSQAYLSRALNEEIERRLPFYTRHLQMIDGLVLSGDHSHKIAKLCYVGGTRAFEGVFTLMNQYGQVAGFWFVYATHMELLRDALEGVARRFKEQGFEGPLLYYTDRCCAERGFLTGTGKFDHAVFDTLQKSGIKVQTAITAAPFLKTPEKPIYMNDSRIFSEQVASIITELDAEDYPCHHDDGRPAFGIDCEWNTPTK